MSDLGTGMTDPRVGAWTRAGVACSSENTARSEEAQGMTTDGETWFQFVDGETPGSYWMITHGSPVAVDVPYPLHEVKPINLPLRITLG